MELMFRDETIHATCDPPELRCECGGKLRILPEVGNLWQCSRCGNCVTDLNSEVEPDEDHTA